MYLTGDLRLKTVFPDEPEANYASSSSSASVQVGPAYYHFPTESTSYSLQPPLPLAEMTAAANLFPQEHLPPASPSLDSKLLMPYDAASALTPNSGLGFFAMADSNLAAADYNDDSDPTFNFTKLYQRNYRDRKHRLPLIRLYI
jgi:hypothetical protein